MTKCERCGSAPNGGPFATHDYCSECSKNLCGDCMKKGCCGYVPAGSGLHADNCEVCDGSGCTTCQGEPIVDVGDEIHQILGDALSGMSHARANKPR